MARKSAARSRPAAAAPWSRSPDDVADKTERLVQIGALLDRGEPDLAAQSLLPMLDLRAIEGDRECELAATALRQALVLAPVAPRPPDALSAAVDRLTALVKTQDEQIRTLHALLEATL